MTYKKINVPENGEKITMGKEGIIVPDNPIIPFIEVFTILALLEKFSNKPIDLKQS